VDEHGILVTGADGQVGTAFRQVLPGATFLTRHELDLSNLDEIRTVVDAHHPTAVINCAAYTNVDAAESFEALATVVNGAAVGALSDSCRALSIPFVTYSTDYVFDGQEDSPYVESDPVDPINAYGRSKLAGERLCLEYPDALVIRTSWVISATHDNFVSTMLRLAQSGTVKVVDDQLGRPTIASDLATATIEAMRNQLRGITHLANQGEATWFQLARAAVACAGLDASVVQPCTTADFPTPARRPAYSVLESERPDVPVLPSWESSLPDVVADQMTRVGATGTSHPLSPDL
jgi:dTDP-4-dehydrorhamnose reductase